MQCGQYTLLPGGHSGRGRFEQFLIVAAAFLVFFDLAVIEMGNVRVFSTMSGSLWFSILVSLSRTFLVFFVSGKLVGPE